MNPYGKKSPGSPLSIPAATWNEILDATRGYRAGKLGRGVAGPGGHGITPAVEILVRNDTGDDLDARAVLAIGEPIVSPVTYPADVQRRPMFAGDAVESSTDPFCILAEPIPAGAIGRAVVQGVAVVDLTVTSTVDTHAGPEAGNTARLVTGGGPAVILSTLTGTGSVRAVVLLPGTNDLAWGADNQFFGGWTSHAAYPDPPDAFTVGTAEIVGGVTTPGAGTTWTVFDPSPGGSYQPGPVCVIPAGSGRVMVRGWLNLLAWNDYSFASGVGEKLWFTVWARLVNIDAAGDPAQWIPAGGLLGGETGSVTGELSAWVPVVRGQWYTGAGAPTGDVTDVSGEWSGTVAVATTLNVGDQAANVCWEVTLTGQWTNGPSASPDVDAISFRALYLGPGCGDTTGSAIEYQQVRPASRLGAEIETPEPESGEPGGGGVPFLFLPRP